MPNYRSHIDKRYRDVNKKHFLSDLPKLSKIDYVFSLINSSFVNLFNSNDLVSLYLNALQELLVLYDNMSKSGLLYKKFRKNLLKEETLYPRSEDFLAPFRNITFNDVNVILLFNAPLPYDINTGVPLSYNTSDLYKPKGMLNKKDIMRLELFSDYPYFYDTLTEFEFPDQIFINDEQILTLEKLIHKRLRLDVVDFLDPLLYRESNIFNVNDWIKQGVLPLNYSITNDSSNNYYDHSIIWASFTNTLLENFCLLNPNLIIVTFGMEVFSAISSLNLQLGINNNVEIINEVELTLQNLETLGSDAFFVKVNTLLSNKKLNIINWIK